MIFGIYRNNHTIDFFIKNTTGFETVDVTELSDDNVYHLKLIIPGEWVVMHSLSLPKMSLAKQKQAISYQLEDKLIKDITDYHFVKINLHSEKTCVITIERNILEKILSGIPKEIFVTQVIPEILLLPLHKDKLTILIDEQRLIALGHEIGFVAQADDLSALVNNQQTIIMGREQQSAIVSCDQYLLSQLFSVTDDFSLLTDNYKQRKARMSGTKNIYITISVIFFIFVFFVLSSLGEIIYLKTKSHKLQQQVEKNYYQIFPAATTMVAPEERVEQVLRKNGTDNGNATLLQLLTKLSIVNKTHKNINVKEMQFTNDVLTLMVNSATSNNIDDFIKALSRTGIKVIERTSNLSNNQFNAVILLKR